MKRWHVFLLTLLRVAQPVHAAAAVSAPAGQVVQLPAFVVDGAASNPVRWLHAEVAGVEILSCLSPAETNRVVNALREQSRLCAWVLPGELRASSVRPVQLVLDDRPLTSLRLSLRSAPSARDAIHGTPSVIIGLALRHWDLSSTYLNSSTGRSAIFSGSQSDLAKFGASVIGTSTLTALQQNPAPSWLIRFWSGAMDLSTRGDLVLFTPPPAPRTNKTSPEKSRPLPSLASAFADPSGQLIQPNLTAATADEAGEWFVRWGLFAGQGSHRASFWNFAKASTLQPTVDDALVRKHFGLSLAELDEVVGKFRTEIQAAPERRASLPLGPVPASSGTRVASEVEIARILGQWTLLAMRENPEFVGPLSGAGRRLLERAREQHGDHPRLAALLGLIELQAGQAEPARALLESVSGFPELDAGARFELARLRSSEALATSGKLASPQVASILAPLATFRAKAPGNPQPLALIAQTWLRAAEKPAREELVEFARLARHYPHRIEILFPTAQLCFAQNLDEEARELVRIALEFARPEAEVRSSLIELQQQVEARAAEKK